MEVYRMGTYIFSVVIAVLLVVIFIMLRKMGVSYKEMTYTVAFVTIVASIIGAMLKGA